MRFDRLIAIAGAALAVGAFVWFAASAFLPFARADAPLEYLLIGAPLWVAAAATAGAALVLSLLVYRVHVTPRALAPLICLAVAPLASVNLLHGVSPRLSAMTYVLVDLRWWWTALILALAALRIDRDAGSPVRQRLSDWTLSPSHRLFVLDGALFLLVLIAAGVTNTHLRFTAVLHGDEVKYLRYCENFYQGLGFEVEHQRTIDELTLAYSPRIGRNFTLAARAFGEELSNLAADARALAASGRTFKFNRARYAEEWFIRGKQGDFYQVHNPGLAFVLFPAYFVDRHFLSTTPGYQGRLPGELPVTNLLCLFIWATWSVVVFRFLRRHTGSDTLAWLLSATAMLTMPVVAFPFQIYPEAVAGLILFGVGGSLLVRAGGSGAAFAMGLAAGFLPWLHVRYLILAVVLFAWGLASLRGRRRLAFAAGFVLLLGAMCFYAYHLTGSFMPDAMYETEGSYSPWRVRDALQALAAYPFDRIWGFFAHAPVYLLALPGIVIAARRQPRAMALGTLLVLALAVPSAGHGFSAAGATPLRHLVAVVPFLMLPLAYTLITWGHLRSVRAALLLLLVVSLDAGFSYTLHHTKEAGRLIDWNTSGWATNLLMPWTHATTWERSWGNFALFLFWAIASTALVLLPLITGVASRPGKSAAGSSASPNDATVPYAFAVVAAFVCFATAATALGREWTRTDYFIPAVEARAAAIRYVAPLDRCALCYSSLRGEVGRGALVANTIDSLSFAARRRVGPSGDAQLLQDGGEIPVGTTLVFSARVAAREGAGWGALAIDFGDGQAARVPNLFGHTDVSHAYNRPGVYRVVATFASAQGTLLQRELTVSVRSVAPAR